MLFTLIGTICIHVFMTHLNVSRCFCYIPLCVFLFVWGRQRESRGSFVQAEPTSWVLTVVLQASSHCLRSWLLSNSCSHIFPSFVSPVIPLFLLSYIFNVQLKRWRFGDECLLDLVRLEASFNVHSIMCWWKTEHILEVKENYGRY